MRRRWSSTSGTPPARKTRTVGWFRGPFGRTSTRRGTARFTRCQSATVGTGNPAACAIAGRWRTRFVEPPKAAWTSMAFSTASAVRMRRVGRPSAAEPQQRERGAAGHVEPHRLAGRGERAVGKRQAQRLGHHLRGGGGAEELAAAPGRAAGAAGERRGLVEGHEVVREPGPERLHRPEVLAALGGERHPAGDDHSRQVGAAGERQHRGGKALVAGRDAEDARAPRQRADLAAHHHRGVVAEGRGCPSSPACPACGRRRGRCSSPRTAARPPPGSPRRRRGRGGPPPSGPCGSRGRSAGRPRPGGRPAC